MSTKVDQLHPEPDKPDDIRRFGKLARAGEQSHYPPLSSRSAGLTVVAVDPTETSTESVVFPSALPSNARIPSLSSLREKSSIPRVGIHPVGGHAKVFSWQGYGEMFCNRGP